MAGRRHSGPLAEWTCSLDFSSDWRQPAGHHDKVWAEIKADEDRLMGTNLRSALVVVVVAAFRSAPSGQLT